MTIPEIARRALFFCVLVISVSADAQSDSPVDTLAFPLGGDSAEFIHVAIVLDAPIETGYFRGASLPLWQGQILLELRVDGTSLDFWRSPQEYMPDSIVAESERPIANLSKTIIASTAILRLDQDSGTAVVDAEDLLSSEQLIQLSDASNGSSLADSGYVLGALDSSKSRLISVTSTNAQVTAKVRYVYKHPSTGNDYPVLGDSRHTAILIQHSFLRRQNNAYLARRANQKVGYFVERKTDLREVGPRSVVDVIQRWDLRKQDPSLHLSPPVHPIVFWIDSSVPSIYRDLVRRGVLAWNIAFEEIGYESAIVVRNRPDDANWTWQDVSKNVILWQTTPRSWFGNGISQRVADPITGEIIGADVILDHRQVKRFSQYAPLLFPHETEQEALRRGAQATEQFVQELTLHEIGHALGLTHNFRGSHAYSLRQLEDSEFVSESGISSSVMDLLPTYISDASHGIYHQTSPGAYDRWAIAYGYSDSLANPEEEEKRLDQLVASRISAEYAFANDADASWTASSGIDPRAAGWDGSSDPLGFAESRIVRIDEAIRSMASRGDLGGALTLSPAETLSHFTWLRETQVGIIAGYIGGIGHVLGDIASDPMTTLVPVDINLQLRAVDSLSRYVFDSSSLLLPADLLARLRLSPRDFDLSGKTEDFKLSEYILAQQATVLDRILSADVLRRLGNSAHYGSTYSANRLVSNLTEAIFGLEIGEAESSLQWNLRQAFVNSLCRIVENTGDSPYNAADQAIALSALSNIYQSIPSGRHVNDSEAGSWKLVAIAIGSCEGYVGSDL